MCADIPRCHESLYGFKIDCIIIRDNNLCIIAHPLRKVGSTEEPKCMVQQNCLRNLTDTMFHVFIIHHAWTNIV